MHYQLLRLITLLAGVTSLLTIINIPCIAAQVLPSPAQQISTSYTHEAIQEIFSGQLPGLYTAQSGGILNYPDKTHGYYVILSDSASDIVMLIADVRITGRREGALLRKGRFRQLAEHLLTRYMKAAPSMEISVDLEKLELPSGDHGAAHMAVSDAKGFVRPQLLTRLQYGHGRTVVMLVGMPGASVPKGHKRNFSQAYLTMESEARDVIAKIRLSDDPLLPSEQYMLWRLRHIFYE